MKPTSTLLLALIPFSVAWAQPDRLVGAIAGRERVAVRGSVHPLAKPEFDQGPVPDGLPLDGMILGLKKTAAQQADLDRFLENLQDLQSPEFHHWLTPEQYADRFGISQNDIARITAWLEASGFQVLSVARGRDAIMFSATASQVEQVQHTPIHFYRANGEMHFANVVPPEIPMELQDLVIGIHGLTDFKLEPPRLPARTLVPVSDLTSGLRPGAVTDSDGNSYMVPDDLAMIYDLNPIYNAGATGAGQTIAVVGASDIDMKDIQAFRALFNLPANDPKMKLVPKTQNPGKNGAMGEADLDLEWIGAFAPQATIYYVFAPDVFQAMYYAIDNVQAPVLSSSFGACEWRMLNSDLDLLGSYAQKAAAEGITWVSSSGDAGAAGCERQDGGWLIAVSPLSVQVPASIPEVTGVGGTEFNEGNGTYFASKPGSNGGTALSYIPEVAWNDEKSILDAFYGKCILCPVALSATGGGASVFWQKPSWQKGPGVPDDGARDVPDISLTASALHDAYVVVSEGNASGTGGTSASTPTFAGFLALLNQYLVGTHVISQPGLGNINPMLYFMGQHQSTLGVYHDITSGNNMVPCMAGSTQDCSYDDANSDGVSLYGYATGPGYDQVTGWGSVDAAKLVASWSSILKNSANDTPLLQMELERLVVAPSTR